MSAIYTAECQRCGWVAEHTTLPNVRKLAETHKRECGGECDIDKLFL